jgi:hypothetical protein
MGSTPVLWGLGRLYVASAGILRIILTFWAKERSKGEIMVKRATTIDHERHSLKHNPPLQRFQAVSGWNGHLCDQMSIPTPNLSFHAGIVISVSKPLFL